MTYKEAIIERMQKTARVWEGAGAAEGDTMVDWMKNSPARFKKVFDARQAGGEGKQFLSDLAIHAQQRNLPFDTAGTPYHTIQPGQHIPQPVPPAAKATPPMPKPQPPNVTPNVTTPPKPATAAGAGAGSPPIKPPVVPPAGAANNPGAIVPHGGTSAPAPGTSIVPYKPPIVTPHPIPAATTPPPVAATSALPASAPTKALPTATPPTATTPKSRVPWGKLFGHGFGALDVGLGVNDIAHGQNISGATQVGVGAGQIAATAGGTGRLATAFNPLTGKGNLLTAHALSAAQGGQALWNEGLTSGAPQYVQQNMDSRSSFADPSLYLGGAFDSVGSITAGASGLAQVAAQQGDNRSQAKQIAVNQDLAGKRNDLITQTQDTARQNWVADQQKRMAAGDQATINMTTEQRNAEQQQFQQRAVMERFGANPRATGNITPMTKEQVDAEFASRKANHPLAQGPINQPGVGSMPQPAQPQQVATDPNSAPSTTTATQNSSPVAAPNVSDGNSPQVSERAVPSSGERVGPPVAPYTHIGPPPAEGPLPARPTPTSNADKARMSPQQRVASGNADAQAQTDHMNELYRRRDEEDHRNAREPANSAELEKHLSQGETVNLQGEDGKEHGTMSRNNDIADSDRKRELLAKHNFVQGEGFKTKEDEAAYKAEKRGSYNLLKRATGVFDNNGVEFVNPADLNVLHKIAAYEDMSYDDYKALPTDTAGTTSIRTFVGRMI